MRPTQVATSRGKKLSNSLKFINIFKYSWHSKCFQRETHFGLRRGKKLSNSQQSWRNIFLHQQNATFRCIAYKYICTKFLISQKLFWILEILFNKIDTLILYFDEILIVVQCTCLHLGGDAMRMQNWQQLSWISPKLCSYLDFNDGTFFMAMQWQSLSMPGKKNFCDDAIITIAKIFWFLK